jgi:5'-nucleotidase / UDP-sugar diphosphatase
MKRSAVKTMLACAAVAALSIALTGCIWLSDDSVTAGLDTRFTFIHTADIHSRLIPYNLLPTATDEHNGLVAEARPIGGAARLAYVVKRERARADRVLYLDSGDVFQGAPIFNDTNGEVEFRFLSALGVDAMALGNHEFDAGTRNLADKLRRFVDFPVLAANYKWVDPTNPSNSDIGKYVSEYQIFQVKGVRVAVIGFGDLGSLSSIGEGGNSLGVTPLQQHEILRHYIRLLHPAVDLIVVLSHLGLTEDQELLSGTETTVANRDQMADGWKVIDVLPDGRLVAWIPGVDDIDLIFGGHLHIVLNPPMVLASPSGRPTILTHSGAFAKYVGRLDVVLRDDTERGQGKMVVSHKYQLFPIDNRLRDLEDMQITKLIEPYLLRLNLDFDLKRVLAYAPETIRRTSNKGNGDSALGNLVTESMMNRRRVEAEFAVTNTLGMRDSLYQGPISMEDMFNVFPFENTVTVMYLSGREVLEMCDYIAERSASRGCQAQAQISGMTFTMNCAQVKVNQDSHPCAHAADCCQYRPIACTCANDRDCTADAADPTAWASAGAWECREETCYHHPSDDILIHGQALNLDSTYKVATNNYIAAGGSGFRVLKRNTTKFDTGISMRDNLIDYLGKSPLCVDYAAQQGICDKTDEFSQKLCKDMTVTYRTVPCINAKEDGRIRRFVSQEALQGGSSGVCSGPGCQEEDGGGGY